MSEVTSYDLSGETNASVYGCNICNKTFSRSDFLKKHLKSHTNPSYCAACGQHFQDRLALAKHQTEVRTTIVDYYVRNLRVSV